ncbi:MAG: CdvA-like protein [Candidatus Freyarchaeota archaeon]|nr:CdvA-like protein [Candidatus Jordarchaeia archaeon]
MVAKARYCAFCGAELLQDGSEEIPNNVLEQLRIRKRIEEIAGEMAFLRNEIDKLTEQISEGRNIEEYALRVKELKEKIKLVKSERSSLEEKLKPLSLEKIAEERMNLEKRIKRLETIHERKEISDETYEKLKKEYGERLEQLKEEHYRQVIKVEKWIEQLKRKIKRIKNDSELLYARYMTGELTKEEYAKEKEKLSKELETNNIYAEMLELLLKKWS